MATSPCQYCTDRTLGCHGICKSYYEYMQKNEEDKKAFRKNKNPIIGKNSYIGSRCPRPKFK